MSRFRFSRNSRGLCQYLVFIGILVGLNRTRRLQQKVLNTIFHDSKPSGYEFSEPNLLPWNRREALFEDIRKKIDEEDSGTRCPRYNFKAGNNSRRIFYGALVADEPWGLFRIVAAETRNIFEAMVFVESNRTQNFDPRAFKHLDNADKFSELFGVDKVLVRPYVNESSELGHLKRENFQREEIIRGWKKLGMTVDDIGFLADPDESFSRDFFRAVQTCDGIDYFDHESHNCKHDRVKLIGDTRVFESSPDCIVRDRSFYHPDMIIGACIEGIADATKHPAAPREPESPYRKRGFGNFLDEDWELEDQVKQNLYPSWNAADFRMTPGGSMQKVNRTRFPKHSVHTGYHFHNFFNSLHSLRHKYRTYGHPNGEAYSERLLDMGADMAMMFRCAINDTDKDDQEWKRVPGGFDALDQPLPIYFHDEEYRLRRHKAVREMVIADDAEWRRRQNSSRARTHS